MEKRLPEKQQFNVWLNPDRRRAALRIAEASGYTNGEIVEIAFAALFGTRDAVLKAKRQQVQKMAKEMDLSGSFNKPEPQLAGFAF